MTVTVAVTIAGSGWCGCRWGVSSSTAIILRFGMLRRGCCMAGGSALCGRGTAGLVCRGTTTHRNVAWRARLLSGDNDTRGRAATTRERAREERRRDSRGIRRMRRFSERATHDDQRIRSARVWMRGAALLSPCGGLHARRARSLRCENSSGPLWLGHAE